MTARHSWASFLAPRFSEVTKTKKSRRLTKYQNGTNHFLVTRGLLYGVVAGVDRLVRFVASLRSGITVGESSPSGFLSFYGQT
jgi:hypothetical protein